MCPIAASRGSATASPGRAFLRCINARGDFEAEGNVQKTAWSLDFSATYFVECANSFSEDAWRIADVFCSLVCLKFAVSSWWQ
jgi:hypothetical protein